MRRAVAAVCVGVVVLGLSAAVATPAGAAPAAPGGASAAHVSSIAAHTLRVSWHNPPARAHVRTQVRALRGTTAPHTIAQGRNVGTVPAARTSLAVSGLAAGLRYSFAVFTTDGRGHVARPAVAHATTLLDAPRYPRSYDAAHSTVVQWRNPSGARRIVVRYAQGDAAPTSTRRGTGVRLPAAPAHRVAVTGLTPGTRYAVSVFALDSAGRASAPAVTRFTTPPAGSVAEQPGTYSGTVVDSDGHPLIGAAVVGYRFRADANGVDNVVTTSRADGTFTLTLPPGQWSVYASGADAVGGNSDVGGYLYDGADVQIAAGGATAGTRFVLLPGAAVGGRVTDAAHRPIGGASVYLGHLSAYVQNPASALFGSFFDYSDLATTQPDGTWTLRGVLPGQPFQQCAYGQNATVAGAPADFTTNCTGRAGSPPAGADTELPDLVLDQQTGGTVTGQVRGFDGRPLSGGIELQTVGSDEDDFGFGGFGQSDPDGTFRVGAVAPGTYRVCADPGLPVGGGSRTGYAPACSATRVQVRAGVTSSADVVEPRGAAVSGTVTGAHGRPLRDVQVQVGPTRESNGGYYSYAATDASGHFTVIGAEAGAHRVCFSDTPTTNVATGIASACWSGGRPVTLESGRIRAAVDLRATAGAAITGTVVDGTGHPVQDAFVYTDAPDEDDYSASDQTDGAGHYRLRGVPSGAVPVCYDLLSDDGDGLQHACRRTVTVQAGRTTTGIDFRVPRPTAIRVTVRDSAGTPVAAVDAAALAPCTADAGDETDEGCTTVTVLGARKAGVVEGSRLTGGDGSVVIDGLTPGPHTVCLFAYHATTVSGGSPTGYADACPGTGFPITVTRGVTTSLDLTLADGGSVSGTVRDTAGNPVTHARVVVPTSAADDNPSAQDDPFDDGIDPVEPGSPAAGSLTAADGTYSIIGVRPGRTTVCVHTDAVRGRSGGYLPRCFGGPSGRETGGTPVTVTAGRDTPGIDVELTPGAELSGRVLLDGKAVPYATVLVFAGRSARSGQYVDAGNDGRWHLGALPAGSYTACAYVEDSRGGQCWRSVRWADVDKNPPLATATLLTLGVGAGRSGIDFGLRRG